MLKIKYIVFGLIVLFSFNIGVFASLTGTVNVNDSLTLRQSPTTSSGVITGLYNGTVLDVLDTNAGRGNGCSDNWYKVSYGKYSGYVCGTYVNLNNTVTNNNGDDSYSRNNYNKALSKDGTIACYEDTGSLSLRSSANGSRTSNKVDCGQEVNILQTVQVNNNSCKYWYQIDTGSAKGYVCSNFVNTTKLSSIAESYYNKKTNGDTVASYQSKLSNAGFPQSYFPYLLEIHARNPKWNFVAEKINLNFDDVVNGESGNGANLLQGSAFDKGYLSTTSNTYNVLQDKFFEYDGEPGWYNASKEAIAYYLDPRNYLNDKYIFSFETLEFRDNQSPSIIESYFRGKTLFNQPYKYYNSKVKGNNGLYSDGSTGKYGEDIVNASKNANVSALHVSSRMLQEVGASGSASSSGASFNYCGQTYSGYYNFFNIGAYATNCATNIQNGLYYAKSQGWNTPYKSFVGGAKFLTNNYISLNQDTIYYEKFDVSTTNGHYTHQYQQNLTAPISEGGSTYNGYFNSLNDYLGSSITFVIPVYNNMPTYVVTAPKLGNPNNYLKSLVVNGSSVSNFSYNTYNYNVYLPENTSSVSIGASSINSSAKINGIGNIKINSNTQSNQIVVTSANGKNRVYTINFVKKSGSGVTVKDAMNNSGFKYNDNYIFGIEVGTNVSKLIGNITSYNNFVSVSVKSANNEVKTNDIFRTGDKVTITGTDGSKTYTVVIYGDTNGDGKITAVDYVQIKNNIMQSYRLSNAYLSAADVNKDGKVTAVDYVIVKNSIIGTAKISQ